MSDLTPQQLVLLAQTGATNREINTALGRQMTPEERAIVDKARVAWRLKRAADNERGPRNARERMRASNERDRLVPYRDPTPEEAARRAKLEANAAEWLAYYLPSRFPWPFGPVHQEIIDACLRAMSQGTSMTVAAPRGFGKTSLLWGMALFGVLTGRCRFAVVIGWKQTAGVELLGQWLDALSENDKLLAAYPCICDPFRDSTQSKRLQSLLRSIEPEERVGCDVRKVRGVIVLPDVVERTTERALPQAALAGASINGSIKGLNIGLLNGESLRPDIVMLDDPQDEITAFSEPLVNKVIRRIDYSVRSLSGPRRRLTVMAAVTCMSQGDVSERLLKRRGTESIRCGQIMSWPKGWEVETSRARALWQQWNEVRLEGLEQHDGGAAARVFYAEHKAEMTEGMTVSWGARYHEGDETRAGDPDALYSAMWDYYDLGHDAFMAERQNAPVKQGATIYALTPELVDSRVDKDRAIMQLPPWSRVIIAATDVNHYGLHTCVVAFGNDHTAAVLTYSRFDKITVPENCPTTEANRIIYEMLTAHGKEIDALPLPVNLWLIDGGYAHEVVQRYVQMRKTLPQAVVARGYGFNQYRPYSKSTIGQPMEYCHRTRWPLGTGIAWHSDYWHEVSQRAWLGSLGAPGSISLFAGHHREFAEQVTAQRLVEKVEGKTGAMWRWVQVPGRNDWGDALAMCYVGAAVHGLGTAATSLPQQPAHKIRPLIYRPSRGIIR